MPWWLILSFDRKEGKKEDKRREKGEVKGWRENTMINPPPAPSTGNASFASGAGFSFASISRMAVRAAVRAAARVVNVPTTRLVVALVCISMNLRIVSNGDESSTHPSTLFLDHGARVRVDLMRHRPRAHDGEARLSLFHTPIRRGINFPDDLQDFEG